MQQVIEQWGYIAVFLIVGIESMGIPVPGETALLAAAVFAANSHLNIIGVIISAILGAIIGDNLGYWAGREWGRPFLQKFGHLLHMNQHRQSKIERYFHKFGGATVLLGRFTAILRAWVAFFAGMNRLHYPVFLAFNALGGILWATGVGLLGYFFGSNITLLETIIRNFGIGVALAGLLLICGYILYRRQRKHREEALDAQ